MIDIGVPAQGTQDLARLRCASWQLLGLGFGLPGIDCLLWTFRSEVQVS